MPLIRILPEQVNDAWEIVGPAIAKALPPGSALHPYSLTNVLRAILAEDAILWGWFEEPDSPDPVTLALTYEQVDNIVGMRNLFIYALASLTPVTAGSKDMWVEGVDTLMKFAKSRNCKYILAYSNHSGLIDLLESLGWSAEFSLLTCGV